MCTVLFEGVQGSYLISNKKAGAVRRHTGPMGEDQAAVISKRSFDLGHGPRVIEDRRWRYVGLAQSFRS